MRHPPVLLRPAAAQTAVTDSAPIAVSSASAAAVQTGPTTANGNSLQHLYSNTGAANHLHTSLPCSSTLHSYSSSAGGGGASFSANGSHNNSTSNNATISDNHNVTHGGPQSSLNSTTTPTPATSGPASAFSGSAHSLIGPLLPSARRYVAVRLLTGETLQFDVEVKSKGKELYAAVARHMSSLGMKSTDIFGLAIQIDGEYLFVDPENKLGKYAPKGWKSSHASGLNNAGHPLLVLYFRVKFYVDSHLLIRDRVTRQHYYYQLRENVLRHGQPATEESFFRLAALALQAELGDYDPERHRAAYFDTQLYFPQWILERVGVDYVVQNMPAMHRDHRCLSTGSAQLLYIKEASSGHTHYGLHLYRLRSSKKSDDHNQQQLQLQQQQQQQHHAHSGSSSSHNNAHRLRSAERAGCDSRLSDRGASVTLDRPTKTHKLDAKIESVLGLPSSSSTDDSSNSRTPLDRTASQRPCSANENPTIQQQLHEQQQPHTGTVWLGICGRGIDIYEEEDSFTKTVRATFQWPNIGKLCFERKKFEIRAVGCPESRKFTYYTSSDDKSKHLLYLCRVTHQFSMAMQPKLAELRKLEEEANRHYQESMGEGTAVEMGGWCDPGSSLERPDRLSLRGYGSLSKGRGGGSQAHGDQRISVISSTSSNTTSGIVSDKVQSVDESEDELDLDERTRPSPAAAPSLESLALAHLRDSCDSLPAELERRNEAESAMQLRPATQNLATGNSNSQQSSSTTLPRRLAGLGARLARVGRSSNKATTSATAQTSSASATLPTSSEMSRTGSLHSSSSQHSASTIHSRSRSKSRISPSTTNGWPGCDLTPSSDRVTPTASNSSASWLRLNSVDVTDGIASMRLQSAAEENQRRSEMVGCQSSNNGNGTAGPGDHNQPHNSGMEEENQYWYSCDDDISETGSTNGEKCPAGVLCTDCRMGIVCCSGSQSQQHHRHHHHRGHEDLPDHHHHHHNHHVNHHHHHLHHAKDPSESSSLCVSVDHTTQDSTLSDCQSYFHSHVSSVDSSLGGSAPPHPLIPAPEMANTPLAATVSALSNGGSLRSLRSAKVSVASASDDCGSAVDYSVQSGPAADSSSVASTSSAAAAAAAMCASPKLDFTVTSAVPNTGTYPRRSTVSNTLDSDSDYVTLPPLCPRMQDNNVVMVPNSYVFMEPMQPKNGGQVTVACVNQLSLRHGVNCKMVDDVASTTYSASSCSSSQMMGLARPMSAAASAAAAAAAAAASEAAARFITTRPTISILQAHTASTAPATQPSFATPAQHLIPPPPYDIRQHPLYNQQQQQQQQQQQSYHPAQIQAQFQSMDGSSSSAGLTCCQYVPPPAGYSSCQQTDAFEPPPPPPPYPIHLQVQAPLTTANLGLHLSQQSVSSLVSKHSLNSMASSARSLEAVSDSHRIVPNNSHAVYAEDSLNDTKTNGSSSLYGVITTDPEVAASVAGSSGAQVAPVIGKNNYLDIHATNTLSRRPQHPIPSSAQQQSASSQIVQQVNGTVTGGASVPYEQYHLGIPPPPQYPGSGGGSNGVNSSKASFATVYTNQVTQSQIEQFKAQLYSDVDYVIYPHKDPSLSQQEYLDVKEAASFISSAASSTYSDQGQMMLMGDGAYLPPPPPYRAPSTKSGASSVYRSSPMPNVHLPPVSSTGGIVLSGTTPASHPPLQHLGYGYSSHHQGAGTRPASVHYASNQSLSSGNYSSSYSTSNYSSNYSAQVPMAYVPYPSKYLSCQSLASSHSSNPSAAYSASGCYSASSSHSMTGSYEPIGAAIQHAGAALRCKPMAPLPALSRVHSEENILTYDLPQVTTLSSAIARHQEARGLLPPPPPYRKQSLDTPSAPGSTCSSGAPSIAADSTCPSEGGKLPGQKTPLDIKTLREKSRNLDLPLISALCNDTTLLNQAKRKPPMGQQQQQQLQQQQQQLLQQQLQQQQLQQQPQQMQQQQQQPQQQQQSVSNIQNMPLPPTPIEAAQGKTTGQPPPKPGGQVNGQSHAYVMPRHPASVSMSQAESSPCRRPALTTPRRNPVAAVQQASQSRPTSWHVDGNNWNVGQGDSAVNGEKSNAPPPPLPPPNSNSAIEAKLQQLQKAAVAIATGPGSIIAEDGKIAKALNLPAFAKSVKNSYVVSPSRKHPVSGLYAVTELGKPPSGSRKITSTAFSHPHNNAGSKVSQHTVPNSSSLSNGKTSFGVVP